MTLHAFSSGNLSHNPITWFLVADGSRAQVYMRDPEYQEDMSKRLLAYEIDNEAELVPVTGMRWHQEASNDTAMSRMIALPVDAAHRTNAFDRLVLIAPEPFLDELKRHLSQPVLDCVTAELPEPTTRYEPEPDLIIEFEFV